MITLFLVGLILGFISATITESFGHKFTGHPTAFQRSLYLKYPRLFYPFLRPMYQHLVIHHHKSFKSGFFDQFNDEEEKRVVDTWIAQHFESDFASLVWAERYNLTLKGFVGTIPFAIPFCFGPLVIGLLLGPVACGASLLCAFIPVWMSKFVHPLIHLPEETQNAGPFVKWLMRTRYMRRVFINHYLHHQELETNFNLLLGGDYLTRLHRKATDTEKLEIQRLLPEFDRRVHLQDTIEMMPAFSQADVEAEARGYLALRNPTYEQRFEHQKWMARVTETATRSKWTDVLESLKAGRTDYGMKLYDKGLAIENWSKNPEFSIDAYPKKDDAIFYRGSSFEIGDVLLSNQASDSDGLFSTLLVGQVSFAHVALFTVLEHNQKSYPAVIEMNEYGARAVPLKVFLSDRFSTYVEVFRHRRPLTSEQRFRVCETSREMIEELHAFDIYQDASQSYYLNCARTTSEILRRAGIETVESQSFYDLRTAANLKVLGIEKSTGQALLMPDDFVKNPLFYVVGTIDNGRFDSLLSRALMRDRIQEIWRTELLDRASFPLVYFLNRFFVVGIQKNAWYSPLLLRIIGMSRAHFPSGPAVFLSLASTSNKRMELGARKLKEFLMDHRQKLDRLSSWEEIKNDLQIRTLVLEASKLFRSMYVEDRKSLSLFKRVTTHSGRGHVEYAKAE